MNGQKRWYWNSFVLYVHVQRYFQVHSHSNCVEPFLMNDNMESSVNVIA